MLFEIDRGETRDIIIEFKVIRRGVDEIPFSSKNPPVVRKTRMQKIVWSLEDGCETVCAKIPESTEPIGRKEENVLYPYGCATLRMTELPLIGDPEPYNQ
ncbi:MAG: hypothetical protein J6B85_02025 [Lachnospiraceae bacterium]|nr:hypothetical protein [Lachnospiraceae bacterium]